PPIARWQVCAIPDTVLKPMINSKARLLSILRNAPVNRVDHKRIGMQRNLQIVVAMKCPHPYFFARYILCKRRIVPMGAYRNRGCEDIGMLLYNRKNRTAAQA